MHYSVGAALVSSSVMWKWCLVSFYFRLLSEGCIVHWEVRESQQEPGQKEENETWADCHCTRWELVGHLYCEKCSPKVCGERSDRFVMKGEQVFRWSRTT